MSRAAPQLCIPVGVVVERRKAKSQWVDFVWRPVAVLPGVPDAAPWTVLDGDADCTNFYAGAAEIELYRSECHGLSRQSGDGRGAVVGGAAADRSRAALRDRRRHGRSGRRRSLIPRPLTISSTRCRCPSRCARPLPISSPSTTSSIEFVKRERDRADPEAMARRTRRKTASEGSRMSEPDDAPENFLQRWSRRKQAAESRRA